MHVGAEETDLWYALQQSLSDALNQGQCVEAERHLASQCDADHSMKGPACEECGVTWAAYYMGPHHQRECAFYAPDAITRGN